MAILTPSDEAALLTPAEIADLQAAATSVTASALNATATFMHDDGTPGPVDLRVQLMQPKPEQFTQFGGAVKSTVAVPAGTDIRQGDTISITQIDGHADIDQIHTYTLDNVYRVPGVSIIRAEVIGYFL